MDLPRSRDIERFLNEALSSSEGEITRKTVFSLVVLLL